MNIRELKQKIMGLPDHMTVCLDERLSEFTYGVANSAEVKYVTFADEDNDRVEDAEEKVLVLSED